MIAIQLTPVARHLGPGWAREPPSSRTTLASLRALTDRAFAEGGITHHGIYEALIAKLEEAEAGDPGALQGYIHLFRAQRGKKVTEAWADRLTAMRSTSG